MVTDVYKNESTPSEVLNEARAVMQRMTTKQLKKMYKMERQSGSGYDLPVLVISLSHFTHFYFSHALILCPLQSLTLLY